ncbi:MAG: hypothetical protein ACJ74G_02540 [Blastocatellia bacterium]
MIKKSLTNTIALSILITALAMTGASQSGPGNFKIQDKTAKMLPGSYAVLGETAAQGQFKALLTFTSDGNVIGDEPSAFETAAHGNWANIGGSQVAYTFTSLIGGADSQLSGSLKVIGTLRLDAAQDKWSGPFKVEVFDASGNVVFTDRGTFTGTRIQIESLD